MNWDHLGLYLRENNYSMYASNLKRFSAGASGIRWLSNTRGTTITGAIARGQRAVLPKQKIPTRLAEIIEFLGRSHLRGRSEIVAFLLDSSGTFREEIAKTIELQLRDNTLLGRVKPASTYGDHAVTLFTWSGTVRRDGIFAREHTMAVLAAAGETGRPLLELEYSGEATVTAVHWRWVSLAGLTDVETARIRSKAATLRARRLAAVSAQGRIGRNDRCPCGSGRKYKRCCGR